MVSRKTSRVIALIVAFLLCSGWKWGREITDVQLLEEYRVRNLVRDSKGNLYRTPDLYGGAEVPIESSVDGVNWSEVGRVKALLTYSAWGSDLFIDGKDKFYFVCSASRRKGKMPEQVIIFSKSDDYGKNWSSPVPIFASHPDARGGYHPTLFVDSYGTIYVIWYAGDVMEDIYLAASQNGGNIWNSAERLRVGNNGSLAEGKDGTVYLTYVGGEGNCILYLSHTRDRGKSWHTEVTDQFAVLIKEPYLKIYKGAVYAVFQGWQPDVFSLIYGAEPEYHTYYIVSKDMGKIWSAPKQLDSK